MNKKEVRFRPFRPGDGQGVVEVLREFYKDDYFNRECYDVDYLEKSSRDGRRIIFVGVAEGDGIVGVAGGHYRAYFPGSYELGLHVFKQAYQGRGLARALLADCVKSMGRMRIYGVYGMAISFHDRSQRECESIGLPATGLWLGRHRSDRCFFAEKPRSPKLHSVVVASPGVARNSGPLFAPARHREFIAGVYEKLHTPFSFANDTECLAELSSYYIKDTEDAHNRDIYVRSIGRDLPDQIHALMRGDEDADSYTVFLNMLDAGCEGVCEKLFNMGFYFTGIHPLHDHSEFIMLHRECRGGYDWDEAVLTPTNRRMLDYILKNKR
ncbi:MAG: GNAT family N-acetyltransferase [Clostridia bacterium]|nr:GNAT family N-acetyltransferase [Clostridia bacterium]